MASESSELVVLALAESFFKVPVRCFERCGRCPHIAHKLPTIADHPG